MQVETAILAIVVVVAIYFGRGFYLKGLGFELHVAEATPQVSTTVPDPRSIPKPRKPSARGKKASQKRKRR